MLPNQRRGAFPLPGLLPAHPKASRHSARNRASDSDFTRRWLYEGNKVRLQPAAATGGQARKVSSAYQRLQAACQRLAAVIADNEGGANKDLARFADQIIALCDKWDR